MQDYRSFLIDCTPCGYPPDLQEKLHMIEPNFKATIEAANRGSPHNHYHIFTEYADGKRGYYGSRMTPRAAKALVAQLVQPTVYDRKGNECSLA